MSSHISVDLKNAKQFVEQKQFEAMLNEYQTAKKEFMNETGLGNEFLGWKSLPSEYDKEEYQRIQKAAKKIKSDSDVLLVIGIGGSYLGAKAAIEMMSKHFQRNKEVEVIFVGQNISTDYIADLIEYVKDVDFSINVISKSGTTTEPALAFRIFKKILIDKYGNKEAKGRIFATTDKAKGALKSLANAEGYESFVVPDDVGGRFSVLTAVGLLPIAVAGIDTLEILKGAQAALKDFESTNDADSELFKYVAMRNLLYRSGKPIEMLINYEPALIFFSEWWKQLFGESEGKDGKGIFVSSASFSTDLHSLGQYIQDGERILFETVINVENPKEELIIEEDDLDLDGLNYLKGKTVDFVNKNAFRGTLLAHVDGGVPNIVITIPKLDEFTFGYMVYFFEVSCAISGYILQVNPFNQPGVEAYKKNMFALLGKPGYEELRNDLLKRLK